MATRFNAGQRPDMLARYIAAVKELKGEEVTSRGGQQIRVYDQYVAIHLGVTARFRAGQFIGDGGHGNAAFLTWHREYLKRFENEVQRHDADLTIPYWDWIDHTLGENVLFTDTHMGPREGGTGPQSPVVSGPFAEANGWELREDLHRRSANPDGPTFGTALRRGNDRGLDFADLADLTDVQRALVRGSYVDSTTPFAPRGFRSELEMGTRLHGFGHIWVGGSMAMMSSPNDPIFFMHHANVDRIWAQWQSRAGQEGTNGFPDSGRRYGHNLPDRLWPWDGGESETLTWLDDLLPVYDPADVVTNEAVLTQDPPDYEEFYPEPLIS